MKKIVFIFLLIFIIKTNSQSASTIKITNIQRASNNTFWVRWQIPNEEYFNFTRYKIVLTSDDWKSPREWPSQVIRVNADGSDAETLRSLKAEDLEQCVTMCLDHAECRFVVKSSSMCYLKEATPSGRCSANDECLSIKKYYHEAVISDLPFNLIFQIQILVYDAFTKIWSQSDLSDGLCTNVDSEL